MALLLYLASFHSDLAFDGLAKAAMVFCWRCAGILACIALAKLQASCCHCCWHCAGVPSWPLKFWPMQRWRLPALCWRPNLHCTGVISSIVLLLLPALRRHCCSQGAGIVALITHPLRWRLPFCRHCHMWCPCLIQCCRHPSFVCRPMPSQQCMLFFCHNVVVGASHGNCHCLGQGPPPGDSGLCRLELFL
jgi:hypothetical protein